MTNQYIIENYVSIQTNILLKNMFFIFEKYALTLIVEYNYSLTYIFRQVVSKPNKGGGAWGTP